MVEGGGLPALLLPASQKTHPLITAGDCGINRRGERLQRDLFLPRSHYLGCGSCVSEGLCYAWRPDLDDSYRAR